MNKKTSIIVIAVASIVIVLGAIFFINREVEESIVEVAPLKEENKELFGIKCKGFDIEHSRVINGQTLSGILALNGEGLAMAGHIEQCSKDIFSTRNFRAGNKYTVFIDTTSNQNKLTHLVYERNVKDFVVYSIINKDSVNIYLDSKDVTIRREKKSGIITSSLWNAMVAQDMPPALAMELSDIYAWSVDFFGVQKGDGFTVIYDNEYIDSVSIGTGMIWGAIFQHRGKEYYAVPFMQDDKLSYWDLNGKSLRQDILKSPLIYSRISSKFSNSRLHPILKIRRPHHGVDYAAPSGTPVHSVADGVVTYRAYTRGGGNTLKIKHAKKMMSGYLHLKSFARGIVNGARVTQGQLIGYVGSTGMSTGPHLDFRIWKNGIAIDPLKVPSEPSEPVHSSLMTQFGSVKDRIVGELNGTIEPSMYVYNLDSIPIIKELALNDNR